MTSDEALEKFIDSKISEEHRELFEHDIKLLRSGWKAAIRFKEQDDARKLDQYRS